MLIAARELNSADLPSQSCVNRHLVYTHGYGAVASPSNAADADGNPNFFLQRHPGRTANGITLDDRGRRRRSTSARTSASYVLTGAEQAEFNYQTRGRDRPVHALQGQGRRQAVELRAARRVRAALRRPRPADLGPDHLEHEAAHGARHPRPGRRSSRRSCSSTPTRTRWCSATSTVWILDGYTTTDQYPYSQSLERRGRARRRLQLRAQLGEGRPSTRTTARSRSTWSTRRTRSSRRTARRSPTCSPTSRDARRRCATHLRYPEDLFKRRRPSMFAPYHVTEPKPFFNRQRPAGWSRPTPARAVSTRLDDSGDGSQQRRRQRGRRPRSSTGEARSTRYYLYIRLPGDDARAASSILHAVRAGVVGQQPDAARVVPHRRTPTRAVRQARVVRDAAGPDRARARCRSTTTINSDPAISQRVHAAEPAGLAGHPGQHAADPGRQLDRLRAADLRRRAGASGAYPAVPVRRRVLPQDYGAVLRDRRCRTASTRCSGAHSTITTVQRAAGPQSGGTGTGAGHDHDDHAAPPRTPGDRRPPPRRPPRPSRRRPGARRSCSTRPRPSSTRRRRRSTATADLGHVPTAGRRGPHLVKQAQQSAAPADRRRA